MRSELSPAVERTLEAAQRWAQHDGTPDVQPRHLLQGLLEEDEGRVAALLQAAGLNLAAARQALAAPSGAGKEQFTGKPLPLHLDSRNVLEAAREAARELYLDRTVTSECLLLSLLRQQAVLRQELEKHGFVFADLEAALQASRPQPLQLEMPLQLTEATERIDTARVLDAAANRGREGLRVIEDYCRFILDDVFLCRELKRLRHDLAQGLAVLPPGLLLESRETLRDVGTALSTSTEDARHSPLDVAQVNLKRVHEALRSLEEFGKLASPDLGRIMKGLRYRSYILERAILRGTEARQRLKDARLYVLVTRSLCTAALDWTIAEAAAGGAHIIQLREKKLPDRELLELARQVRQWTRKVGVLFIVNDRPDLARLVEADGVHLGQDDFPVKEARRVLGPEALIGVSTHTLDQLQQAVLDGASYLGVGPTFASGTKEFAAFPGLDFVRQAAAETSLPAFVIGGIDQETIGAAAAAGARRVAVSRALCQADDPRAVAAALLQALPA